MWSVDKSLQNLGVTPAWRNQEGTLLYKGSVDNPDGTVQGGGSRWSGLGCTLSPHSLNPVQHEYQHTNHGWLPQCKPTMAKIKRSKEGEDADFLLGLLNEDSHPSSPGTACWSPRHVSSPGWWWWRRWPDLLSARQPIWSEGSPHITAGFYLRPRPRLTAFWVVQRKRLRVLMPHDFEHCKENPASGFIAITTLPYTCLPNPKKTLGNHFWRKESITIFISVWIVVFFNFLMIPLVSYLFPFTGISILLPNSFSPLCLLSSGLAPHPSYTSRPQGHSIIPSNLSKLHQPTQIHLFFKTLLKLYGECTTTLNLIRVSVLSCFICRLYAGESSIIPRKKGSSSFFFHFP